MKTVIYIDMLFLQGVIINYALLLCTARFSTMNTKRWRLILAASFGGVASFIIFLPSPSAPLQIFIKVVVTAIIVLIAFSANIRGYIKAFMWYILFNCLLAGLLLLFRFAGGGFQSNNLQLYFDISAFWLIVTSLLLYFIIMLIRVLFNTGGEEKHKILIDYRGQSFTLDAYYDSGFTAHDIFQSAPLILISYKSCKKQLPKEIYCMIKSYFLSGMPSEGMSVLPLGGVGGSELTATIYPVSVESDGRRIENVKLCFSKKNIEADGAGCLLSKEFMEVLGNAHKTFVTE